MVRIRFPADGTEARYGSPFHLETELWAREDWQKVSSSLSHDAFIWRSLSVQHLMNGFLSRSPLVSLVDPRQRPEYLVNLVFSLPLSTSFGRQWARRARPLSLRTVASSTLSRSLFPFHLRTFHECVRSAHAACLFCSH